MTTDAEILDIVQKTNAKTDAACHGKPLLGKVRTALLQTEQKAHSTGWDGPDAPPRLFFIYREQETDGIGIEWADLWNTLLPQLMKATNSNLGKCLKVIAEGAEAIRSASLGDLSSLPAWASRSIVDSMIERAQRGEDLHSPRLKGFEIFGYGVRFEGWSAVSPPRDEAAAAALHRASQRREIDKRPDRLETRVIHAVTRDDRTWLITRYRRFRPFADVLSPSDGVIVYGRRAERSISSSRGYGHLTGNNHP